MDFHAYGKQNKRKTSLFVFYSFVLLGIVISALSFYFFQTFWAIVGSIVVTSVVILCLYLNSTKIALGLTGAKEVSYEQSPHLHNLVDEMVLASGITKPKIYMIEDTSLNAFAAGSRDEGYVVFTRGILDNLNRDELQGVTAHEISHLNNGDSRLMTVVASVGLAIGVIAEIGVRMMFFGGNNNNNSNPIMLILGIAAIIFAPLAAMIIQASVSREREWLADATAVDLTRNPAGLRSALEKLSSMPNAPKANMQATSHLWIAAPVNALEKGKQKKRKTLFDTHPPINERIHKLRSMESLGEEQG